ncbi:hypothetical protein NYO91_07450 [Arhodomonas aquaeolei]|uniref:hypothetical protein n=1 Tax=Arhodomonas aquaeolei TaxID=2369 RepID=UPI00216896ED|nr:hypothetical protein [Arhodomonas aquaeolei]MCS4503912.1 hypothetical protein [Arhodomonas aquaeolei]
MKGIPHNSLKTAQDYEGMQQLAIAGELRPRDVATLRRYWQSLLDGRWRYDRDRLLGDSEAPDGDEPDYRVLVEEAEDGTEERWQYKRVADDKARIHHLGYDVATVEGKIAELEGVGE